MISVVVLPPGILRFPTPPLGIREGRAPHSLIASFIVCEAISMYVLQSASHEHFRLHLSGTFFPSPLVHAPLRPSRQLCPIAPTALPFSFDFHRLFAVAVSFLASTILIAHPTRCLHFFSPVSHPLYFTLMSRMRDNLSCDPFSSLGRWSEFPIVRNFFSGPAPEVSPDSLSFVSFPLATDRRPGMTLRTPEITP